jgi:hypothetical protein
LAQKIDEQFEAIRNLTYRTFSGTLYFEDMFFVYASLPDISLCRLLSVSPLQAPLISIRTVFVLPYGIMCSESRGSFMMIMTTVRFDERASLIIKRSGKKGFFDLTLPFQVNLLLDVTIKSFIKEVPLLISSLSLSNIFLIFLFLFLFFL